MFDKRKFLAILIIKDKTVVDIAELLGVSKRTVYNKINGQSKFYLEEVMKIRDYLNLSDVESIFFAKEIAGNAMQKTEDTE